MMNGTGAQKAALEQLEKLGVLIKTGQEYNLNKDLNTSTMANDIK